MSDNVIRFHGGKPEHPSEDPSELADHYLLTACENWQEARGQQMAEWARHEKASQWGRNDDSPLDFDALGRMHSAEHVLSGMEPRTAGGAQRMLEVAIEITAYREIDPEHTFADGPVLEIMRNVRRALARVDSELPLGPKRKAEAKA
jgi:hypothetical protein